MWALSKPILNWKSGSLHLTPARLKLLSEYSLEYSIPYPTEHSCFTPRHVNKTSLDANLWRRLTAFSPGWRVAMRTVEEFIHEFHYVRLELSSPEPNSFNHFGKCARNLMTCFDLVSLAPYISASLLNWHKSSYLFQKPIHLVDCTKLTVREGEPILFQMNSRVIRHGVTESIIVPS